MHIRNLVLSLASCTALMAFGKSPALADADLFMRDRPADTGVEPYTGPGPIYTSEDIWVRHESDPNYSPLPFPTSSPTWVPLPHQNPEYRPSLTGRPNYIYVQVSNRGDMASTGSERLRVYQAKAGTGLAWPAQWVDYVDTACGDSLLHGIEVTKPRLNAKTASATERDAYRDALIALNADPAYQYTDGVQYWRKQNDIHAGAGNPEHGNPAFLPWHREMVNRFEAHLKEVDPLVTLLYWDWTEDPRVGVNLFTTDFMGASNGIVSTPLTPLQPPTLTRDVAFFAFSPDSDASINANSSYSPLRTDIEQSPNHDNAHGFIGGLGGQISGLSSAVQDPFFFQLHGNVDRLWANWQRDPDHPERLDSVAGYGTDASNPQINGDMSPWDGNTGLDPWVLNPTAKTSKDRSVLFPPIYDTAPLNIPILQPGESVIIEIPWYPPNVADFNCLGDSGHFCLLARIETDVNFPFGMTFAEGTNVGTNTTNNNNIVWKNLTIIDDEPDLFASFVMFTTGLLLRNTLFDDDVFEISLVDRTSEREGLAFEAGEFSFVVPEQFLDRIIGADLGDGILLESDPRTDERVLRVEGEGAVLRVPLAAKEMMPLEIRATYPLDLDKDLRTEPIVVDVEQAVQKHQGRFTTMTDDEALIGGVRFEMDLSKIRLVEAGAKWIEDDGSNLKAEQFVRQGESREVKLPIDEPEAEDARFLARPFIVGDPGAIESLHLHVRSNGGALLFINGVEILRQNLDDDDRLLDDVGPFGPHVMRSHRIDPEILREGENVITAMALPGQDKRNVIDIELTVNDIELEAPPILLTSFGADGLLDRTHFSAGEPIPVQALARDARGTVADISVAAPALRLENTGELAETITIDEPGLHEILVTATDDNGNQVQQLKRVLISKSIPPIVSFRAPTPSIEMTVGQNLPLQVDVEPAFQRDIKLVSLYASGDNTFMGGTSLAENPEMDPVDKDEDAPFELTFRPETPGMYMLQLGAVDDNEQLGVSGHLHVMVR